MIFHPGILALLLGSGLISAMLCISACHGMQIIRHWDIRSGSERQLEMERRTYLVSTVMTYALGFQILSLFLFIYTADALSPLFVGAMCAAGSLKVNGLGYPALIGKIINCLLAGLWLIVNAADNKAPDYPLIRTKYWLLLLISPLMLAETFMQSAYLLSLRPNVITSCCALSFSAESNTILSNLLSLPRFWSQIAFIASMIVTLTLGVFVFLKNKGALLFSLASLFHFLLSINALISFVSTYIYELPTHHCPFCLLHQEYGYIGYPLYGAMLISVVAGMGVGVIHPFRAVASLKEAIPLIQTRLALVSVVSALVFAATAGYAVLFSHLSMTA